MLYPSSTRSVRRASGFVLVGYGEIGPEREPRDNSFWQVQVAGKGPAAAPWFLPPLPPANAIPLR